MTSKIVRKMSDSHYLTIPSDICKKLCLEVGSFVDMDIVRGKIIITPVAAAKHETGATDAPAKRCQ